MKVFQTPLILLTLLSTHAHEVHGGKQKLLRGIQSKKVNKNVAVNSNIDLKVDHGSLRQLYGPTSGSNYEDNGSDRLVSTSETTMLYGTKKSRKCKSFKASNKGNTNRSKKSSGNSSKGSTKTSTKTGSRVSSVKMIDPECVAIPDMFFTKEGTPVTIKDLLENDNKLEDDTLTMGGNTLPLNGDLVDNGDGTFVYNPNEGFIGIDTFEYTVVDGIGQEFIGLVSITVAEVNEMPDAVDDVIYVVENSAVLVEAIDILGNDFDPDGDTLSIEKCTKPKFGDARVKNDGSFTYTPDSGFVGEDMMVCTIVDGNGGKDTSTIQFVVGPREFATIDIFVTVMNSAVTVNSPGILENDDGFSTGKLSVESCAEPGRGTLTYSEDGSFIFTPNDLFIGIQSIECHILDGNGGRDTSNIVILVRPPFYNVNNALYTDEDVPLTIEPGDILTSIPINDDFDVTSCYNPTFGTIVQNVDGSFLYTPEENFHGNDIIECIISDPTGENTEIVVVIEVRPVDDAPEAVNDAYVTNENTPVTFDPLDNDLNPDKGETLEIYYYTQPSDGQVVQNEDKTLTYTPSTNFVGENTLTYTISDGKGSLSSAAITITVNARNTAPIAVGDSYSTMENTVLTVGSEVGLLVNDIDSDDDSLSVASFTKPAHGTITMFESGGFTYTPKPDWFGEEIFEYTVEDSFGIRDTATVKITVVPEPNLSPVTVDDNFDTDENTPITFNVLANDSDPDGDVLSVVPYTQPLHGEVIINNDNTLTYVPEEGWVGEDRFEYVASDGNGGESVATVTIEVIEAANTDPVAVDDQFNADENRPLTFNALQNDSDPDGDTIKIIRFTNPLHGVLTLNLDQTFTYVPKEDWSGVDSFEYEIFDGRGGEDKATVTITVIPTPNRKPVAADDEYETGENIPITFNVLANDFDPDGDALTVLEFTSPLHGSLTKNADGSLTYTPNTDWHGIDRFQYEIVDGEGGLAAASVVITVNPAPLKANDDSYKTFQLTPLTVDPPGVLENDKSAVSVKDYSLPTNGDLTASSDGGFTYTPKNGFIGVDTFEYTAVGFNGETSKATVSITVETSGIPPLIIPGEGEIPINGENSTFARRSSDCKGVDFLDCNGVNTVEDEDSSMIGK